MLIIMPICIYIFTYEIHIYFINLLGGVNIDETDTFEPETIFEGTLDIDTEVFTKEEYLVVNTILIDGKSI